MEVTWQVLRTTSKIASLATAKSRSASSAGSPDRQFRMIIPLTKGSILCILLLHMVASLNVSWVSEQSARSVEYLSSHSQQVCASVLVLAAHAYLSPCPEVLL